MKLHQQANTSIVGLISLVLLYIFIIILIILFSGLVLKDISTEGSFSNFIVIPMAVVFPLFLLGSLGFNITRLIRERRHKHPGIKFKIRLILFFTLIAILSAIPQGVLSFNFIDTAMKSWFSHAHKDALRNGLKIALTYYDDKINNLKSFSESAVFLSLIKNTFISPRKTWNQIQSVNPFISSIQIYDMNNKEIAFDGDEQALLSPESIKTLSEGLLSKESSQGISMIRQLTTVRIQDRFYKVVLTSLLPKGFETAAKQLSSSHEAFVQFERFQTIFRFVLILVYLFFSVPIIFLVIMVSFLLSEELIRPLINLEEAIKKVSGGDYSIRILSRSHDELSVLITSFNKMVNELENSRRKIMQTEKVTAWQEIAQRLAHEIKNPLTPIKLSAQRILKKSEGDPVTLVSMLKPSLNAIIHEVDTLNSLLSEFGDFARLPAPQLQESNLKEVIEAAVLGYTHSYPQVKIDLSAVDPNIILNLDRKQIKQVFSNLLKNALEAIQEQGAVFIRADLVKKGNSRYCRMQIQDSGSGIDEIDQSKVFHPYFTTKRSGTGLGLSIVERIIFDHRGQIWLESQKGVGTTFFIDLPMEI